MEVKCNSHDDIESSKITSLHHADAIGQGCRLEKATQTEVSLADGLSNSKIDTINIPELNEESFCHKISESEVIGYNLPSSSSNIETTQLDAAHPLFNGYRHKKRSIGTSTEEDKFDLYYCHDCKVFMYKSLNDLTKHFKLPHKPYDSCIYCKEPVYLYMCCNKRLIYHRCSDTSHSNNSVLSSEKISISEYNNNDENVEKKLLEK